MPNSGIIKTTESYQRRLTFSLRALIIAVVIAGAGIGLIGKAAIDYANRPTPEELRAASEKWREQLNEEFTTLNPVSLVGWQLVEAGKKRQWRGWSKDGIAYYDRNADGLPDMKYREDPRLSTTEVWWEDSDYDGMFDIEVTQGCFEYATRPLSKLIAVPRTSAEVN